MPTTAPDADATGQVAELFEAHRGEVYAYLIRLSNDAHLAEELTQETFLRVFQARDRLAAVANRRAWVFRVATNVCFDALRRRRRFAWLSWDADAHGGAAGDMADEVSRRDVLERALARVPQRYRAPLLLFSHHGLSVAEVAGVLGLSPGAVRTRVYRAKELFRQAYERECRT